MQKIDELQGKLLFFHFHSSVFSYYLYFTMDPL